MRIVSALFASIHRGLALLLILGPMVTSADWTPLGVRQIMSSTVSLIIPTLNAASEIEPLLNKLERQTRPIDELVVVDSSSDDGTADVVRMFAGSHPNVNLQVIARTDFDHGETRDQALRTLTSGEFVLFMTQDAVPADERYIEHILRPFEDPMVGVVSGRQLPKAGARVFERMVRKFNYPEQSFTRGKDDLIVYGIKTFYTSDVCSAYRRDAYLEVGGFCRTMMSEDMYLAAKLVAAGYLVAYEADARVYHSHNLTPRQQYRRNYAVGRFLEEHQDVLMNASEIGEGKKLAFGVAGELLRGGHIGELCAFGVDCVARFTGNRAGRRDARDEIAKER